MDMIVDKTEAGIAQHIRLERDARNWSLADLAERSGVAKASISKIERGEMSPSAGLLVRLAAAADQPVWRDPATGYRRRQIFSRPDHPLEMVQVELPAGETVSFPAWTYAHARHVVWVQMGELVLTEARERHLLRTGDSLGFGAPAEVTYANESTRSCHYVVALARS